MCVGLIECESRRRHVPSRNAVGQSLGGYQPKSKSVFTKRRESSWFERRKDDDEMLLDGDVLEACWNMQRD